ncbi:6-carboxytetrahydropterin synthase QueD [Chitinivibrio alkaliphilus]|uniref:6-carboxy-5,6,7,8-tetrahydropterin synthase n=1 Tax=Chitinivibrio alkaliphilus ACht1 TaxID=1313304 RepID=U7D5F0_9BACT|nr:6-carboxytetrahydropterin synthase QueD [Chitinivibrio alkaliphilus]ERP30791.1 putative 6-pyruvoyl tetrahydropterin synthase [Chitinivibrio alkaliphilus ACht1]
MYEVSTEQSFSAAHYLRNYNGACENLHGHNWKVRVTVRTEVLDSIGLAIDFKILKKNLKDLLDTLDHTCINETVFTESYGNPSSENLSKYLFIEMRKRLSPDFPDLEIGRVDVWETPGNCASYYE